MIYIYNKNIQYIYLIIIYIIIYDGIINPQIIKIFIYTIIIIAIGHDFYLKDNINHVTKLLVIVVILSMINGIKYYIQGGWIVHDAIENNHLKYYYFVGLDGIWCNHDSHQWIVKIQNKFTAVPYGSPKFYYQYYLHGQNSIHNIMTPWIKKCLPIHHNLIIGILSGKSIYLKSYKIIRILGLQYLMVNFSQYFSLIQKIILKFLIFLWPWPILYHRIGYGLGLLIMGSITVWNGKINIIRCFCVYGAQWLHKMFQLPYNPMEFLFMIFIIFHTYNGLWIYHPSFLMGFFIGFLHHLINKNSIILDHYGLIIPIKKIIINGLLMIFSLYFFKNFYFLSIIMAFFMEDIFKIFFIGSCISLLIPPIGAIMDNIIGGIFLILNPWKFLKSYGLFSASIINYSHLMALIFMFFYLFRGDFIKISSIVWKIFMIILLYLIYLQYYFNLYFFN